MPTDTHLTATGNLAADPVLRFTPSGSAVASFTVACNDRRKNPATNEWETTGTLWLRCTAWDRIAETAADQLTKGHAVTVTGRLKPDDYEKDGIKHTGFQLHITNLAVPLRTTSPTKGRNASSQATAAPFGANDRRATENASHRAAQRFGPAAPTF
ncbi:single-stranded DNA-binding protein [Streptomyces sp. QH1-20]|uniref:single-stranded DNA-binding protein n=1 Tax=Streptomyces sp. QH1-20 TaxID=3240934 RepID=UPI003511C697